MFNLNLGLSRWFGKHGTSNFHATPDGFFDATQSTINVWYSKITDYYGATPSIDANSATLISDWSANQANFNVAIRKYYQPVYYATATDPHYDIVVSPYPPTGYTMYKNVPVPMGATPDLPTVANSGDAHLCIVDTSTGCMYEMWHAQYDAGTDTWTAGAMIAGPYPSKGQFANAGVRASGIPCVLGMIFPEDILNGVINHAIGFSAPNQGNKVLTPAQGGGAWFTGGTTDLLTHNVHCGIRARLKPSYDISGLTGAYHTIAKALQDYGMIMIDGGGPGVGLGGGLIHGGHTWDEIPESFSGGTPLDYLDISSIPLNQFEVLNFSAAIANPASDVERNACSNLA